MERLSHRYVGGEAWISARSLTFHGEGELTGPEETSFASYEADRLTYEQYKDSDSEEKQSWAEQAKMRANKTASTYNNYILENSYVWSQNVPGDIRDALPYLD